MVQVTLAVAVLTVLAVKMDAAARNRPQDHDSQERGPDDARNAWHNVSLPHLFLSPGKAYDVCHRHGKWSSVADR
jgi:hypothetical protein